VQAGDGDDVTIHDGQAVVVADRAELDRIDAMYAEKYVDPHSGAGAAMGAAATVRSIAPRITQGLSVNGPSLALLNRDPLAGDAGSSRRGGSFGAFSGPFYSREPLGT
jgi:hypothetical protein